MPDPIKVLIGRLQIPILKVAILDSSFFNHKKHPARQLLDSISKASLGWSDDQQLEDILIKKLEKIVDFLLLEFDQDIAIFEQALDEFQQFLKDENDKIDAKVPIIVSLTLSLVFIIIYFFPSIFPLFSMYFSPEIMCCLYFT